MILFRLRRLFILFPLLHLLRIMLRRTPEILFKHPRKIQRLRKTAHISDLRHILLYIGGGAKQLFRHLHTQACKVIVRRHSHLAFKQLAQIIVAERNGLQILVKLVVAVGAVLHDIALYSANNISERLGALKRYHVIYDKIPESLDNKLLVADLAVKIVKSVVEGCQNVLVAVVRNNNGIFKRKGGVLYIYMYVGKAFVAVVHVRYSGGDYYYISQTVIQRGAVKNKLPAAARTVNQLPAFMGVTVH